MFLSFHKLSQTVSLEFLVLFPIKNSERIKEKKKYEAWLILDGIRFRASWEAIGVIFGLLIIVLNCAGHL